MDVESSSEETKNSAAPHVTDVRSVNDTSNYLTPSEVRGDNNDCNNLSVKPALTINGNMNYLTSTEVGDNVYYTPRDSQPEDSTDHTSKLGNTNYLTPHEIEETRQAEDITINGNQGASTNYLMPDEIQPSKNGNVYHTSTNYLLPGEVSRDSDSESEDLTPVTRQNVNYLTKDEVDELEGDSDPKLEIKIDRAPSNMPNNGNAASRASTTIDPNNRRSVLYLQPSEIQFSDDDDDEHVFGAATLHVPKLALPTGTQPTPAKKGNAGYFESAPSRGSLQSATSSATLPAVTPRVTARGPNYTGPSTLSSLNSARDELEDSFSDDETDTWSDKGSGAQVSGSVPAASVVPSDSSDMYWNSEYQHVLAMSEGVEKYQRLSRLAQDFVYAAQVSHVLVCGADH